MSALYGAAGIVHDPDLTRVLLDAGADPDDGESLYHSTEAESPEGLRLLLARGAQTRGTNALASCARRRSAPARAATARGRRRPERGSAPRACRPPTGHRRRSSPTTARWPPWRAASLPPIRSPSSWVRCAGGLHTARRATSFPATTWPSQKPSSPATGRAAAARARRRAARRLARRPARLSGSAERGRVSPRPTGEACGAPASFARARGDVATGPRDRCPEQPGARAPRAPSGGAGSC